MTGHPLPEAKVRGGLSRLGVASRLLVIFPLFFLLAGCFVKRSTYDIPKVPVSSEFKNKLADAVSERTNKTPASDKKLSSPPPAEDSSLVEWWRYFGNRELEALINRGMANNPDVRIATIRLSQAKVRAEQAGAGLLPSLGMPVTMARQAPGGSVGVVPTGTNARAPQTSIQSSLRGDFRLDIWGEQSALAESAQMQVWRAAFERDNVQRNVTATIASNYVEYAALNDRLRVAKETERALSDTLATVEKRLELGDATVADLQQQRALVFGLRAAIPSMQQQREDAVNTLAFLVGSVPGALKLSDQGLESMRVPEVVPGLPSALLLRRPDVRMVEARLLAADADIDVARARILPPVDLSAQGGYSSNALAQLFLPKAFFWSTVANLTTSIFDGGKRANEKKYNEAMYEELVETYIRTIYQSMREVEGALATIRLAGNRMGAQREAALASRKAWEINTRVYAMGGADQMSLLETERTFHRYQDEYQRAQMDHYRGYISLFQALGGGVKPAASLPGKGHRPAAAPGGSISTSAAVNPATKAFSVEGIDIQSDGLAGMGGLQGENFWLIELPGLYHRSTVGAAWRDLRERYPEFMEGRMLRPRLSGRIEEGTESPEAWYRLSVAKFSSKAEATAFCDRMTSSQERCEVRYSKAGDEPKEGAKTQPDSKSLMNAATLGNNVPDDRELAVNPEKSAETPVSVTDAVQAVVRDEIAPLPKEEKSRLAYTIQLGAFSNPENAAIALSLWRARGYDPYVSEIMGSDDRMWYTVRTGQYEQRRDGLAAVQLIRRKEEAPAVLMPTQLDPAGKPTVIDVEPLLAERLRKDVPILPEPPEDMEPVSNAKIVSVKPGKAAKKTKSIFAVQLGAFSTRDNARVALDFWRNREIDVYLSLIVDAEGRPWFAVRTGHFASRKDASATALQLGRQENTAALVVPDHPESIIAEAPVEVVPERTEVTALPETLPASSLSQPGQPREAAAETQKEKSRLKPARYSVQLGAFASIENAAKAFAEWQARGYEPYVCEADDGKGNLRFVVRTGTFQRKAEAQKMIRSILRQDGQRGVLVQALLDERGELRSIDVTPLLSVPELDLPASAELSVNDVR